MSTTTRPRPSPLFTEDFDGTPPPPRAPPPPTPPTPTPSPPTPEEIEARMTDSYGEGLRAGIERATADQVEVRRRMLDAIATGLVSARADAAAAVQAASSEIASLLVTCLTTAFPRLTERLGPAEAASFARQIVAPLYGVPEITLRCSPHAVAALEDELAALESGIRDAIRITPTDAMTPGDVRITWGVALAERDSRALWRQMQDVLSQAGIIPFSDIQDLT